MTFTYLGDQSTNVDIARLIIGDTHENEGVRPDGRNLSDEEISYFISAKGRLTWGIAFAFEVLSNEWAKAALSERMGDHAIDAREVTKEYKAKSQEWYAKQDLSEQGGAIQVQVWSEYDTGTSEADL